MEERGRALFDAVANRDYDALADLYGRNARDSIASYLAMSRRWRCGGEGGKGNNGRGTIGGKGRKRRSYSCSSSRSSLVGRRIYGPHGGDCGGGARCLFAGRSLAEIISLFET